MQTYHISRIPLMPVIPTANTRSHAKIANFHNPIIGNEEVCRLYIEVHYVAVVNVDKAGAYIVNYVPNC
jgi:hypothetical protein